jgi:hypothetical protein
MANSALTEDILATLPELTVSKLRMLQQKLGTDDLDSALDKSLNIANYVADTVSDPDSKLLVERQGRYTELKEIA